MIGCSLPWTTGWRRKPLKVPLLTGMRRSKSKRDGADESLHQRFACAGAPAPSASAPRCAVGTPPMPRRSTDSDHLCTPWVARALIPLRIERFDRSLAYGRSWRGGVLRRAIFRVPCGDAASGAAGGAETLVAGLLSSAALGASMIGTIVEIARL
jgi:hypothetical protein